MMKSKLKVYTKSSPRIYPWLGQCGSQNYKPLHIAMFINEHTGFVVWTDCSSSEILGGKASTITNYDHYHGVIEISN